MIAEFILELILGLFRFSNIIFCSLLCGSVGCSSSMLKLVLLRSITLHTSDEDCLKYSSALLHNTLLNTLLNSLRHAAVHEEYPFLMCSGSRRGGGSTCSSTCVRSRTQQVSHCISTPCLQALETDTWLLHALGTFVDPSNDLANRGHTVHTLIMKYWTLACTQFITSVVAQPIMASGVIGLAKQCATHALYAFAAGPCCSRQCRLVHNRCKQRQATKARCRALHS